MTERDGTPLWINPEGAGAMRLKRADFLRPTGENERMYDEAWLQGLLHQNPEALPIEQIERGFGELVPLCTELPLPLGPTVTGYLDNLFITPEGRLVLVETKLWRSHEARRKVIAQAMEYAASLFALGYEDFQSAVLRARKREAQQFSSLYEIVAQHRPIDEAAFVDAVSWNLARGRAIIAVVGDGIQEELISLAEFLQGHAGHRFVFALIEMRIYEAPQDDVRIVVPSILAQTQLIDRGVIEIEDNGTGPRITLRTPSQSLRAPVPRLPLGIAADEFFEILDQKFPGSSSELKRFLEKAEELGVRAEWQNGLNLKYPDLGGVNFGAIWKDGTVDISMRTAGRYATSGKTYCESIALDIGGTVGGGAKYLCVKTAAGKMPRLPDLLPKHEAGWLGAIERYIGDTIDPSAKGDEVVNAKV